MMNIQERSDAYMSVARSVEGLMEDDALSILFEVIKDISISIAKHRGADPRTVAREFLTEMATKGVDAWDGK